MTAFLTFLYFKFIPDKAVAIIIQIITKQDSKSVNVFRSYKTNEYWRDFASVYKQQV